MEPVAISSRWSPPTLPLVTGGCWIALVHYNEVTWGQWISRWPLITRGKSSLIFPGFILSWRSFSLVVRCQVYLELHLNASPFATMFTQLTSTRKQWKCSHTQLPFVFTFGIAGWVNFVPRAFSGCACPVGLGHYSFESDSFWYATDDFDVHFVNFELKDFENSTF